MNKQVLITGATSGIGYAFAKIFAERGYDLVIASRNVNKMEKLKANLQQRYDVDVQYISIDLSTKNGASTLYRAIKERNYNIDILVNNAGVGIYGEVVNVDEDRVLEMLQLNIASLTELTMKISRDMKEKFRGYILNVASTAAYQPLPYMASYAASKSYVLSFTEAISKELEDYGIVVTCLSPGATDTEFFKVADIGEGGVFSAKMDAKDVAQIGIDALFSKKLSVISGFKNYLLANSSRFVPRDKVAEGVKKMLKKGLKVGEII